VRIAAVLLAALVLAPAAEAKLPPLPKHWPTTLQLGLSQHPGDTAGPYGFRYQYLAGGVNTGSGWATWNPDGTFASLYAAESWRRGKIPVFTYYQLLQSKPGSGDEAQADLANLRNAGTMRAYWADVELLFRRIRSTKTAVVHVEPDLWGYLEQANATALAAQFAQRWVAERNRLAPNVVLAWHMSGWGTKHDVVYEDPPDATVKAYAARSAAFYRSLHARFDLSFEDFSDRDSGFYEHQQGNAKVWFTPADFHRHLLYAQTFVRLAGIRLAAWQIPLGNMSQPDTWGRYKDNRVEWLLGAGGRAHLRAYANAGVVAFLFGAGADGNTTEKTDGGTFAKRAGAYYGAGPLQLPS
jgi:hypothetical protein